MGDSALLWLFAGLFGLAVGSFLNVCIYRVPRDLSVVTPRSFCPGCESPFSWWDNIPLISFARLSGRCSHCHGAIPHRYWMVELMTSAVFVSCLLHFGLSLAACKWAVFGSMLITLFWTDLETRILPDEITIGGTIVGVVFAFAVPVESLVSATLFPQSSRIVQSLTGALVGSLVLAGPMWICSLLYARLRGREGLGFGDIKLLLLLGTFLGVRDGIFALMLSSVAGSVVGIAYAIATRKSLAESELPFGSFLCAGAAAVAFIRL